MPRRKPTPIIPLTPSPGEPRPCSVAECRTLFVPGKTGADGRCYRCYHSRAAGRPEGGRQRQPRGQAKVAMKGYVKPDLANLVTNDILAVFGVKTQGELVELALARLLGREDLGPAKKSLS